MRPKLVKKIASLPGRPSKPARVPTLSRTVPRASATLSPHPPTGPIYRLPAEKLLLYADRGLVVINKPNGLISQLSDPLNKQTEPSVDADVFSSFLEDLRDKLGQREPLRTLHRLDKPTTGALALARHRQSAREFSNQLAGRQVEKTYLALVVGDASQFPEQKGTIETELECGNGWVRIPGIKGVYERDRSELPTNRQRGEHWVRDAVSEYEVLATSRKVPLSLLRLRLHTGLKHQLRVHLAQALRTPILGDALYLDPRSRQLRDIKAAIDVPRSVFLHSSRLSLKRYCPKRTKMTIGAPLPLPFIRVCEDAGIPLDRDDISGGVWVDDAKALGPDVQPHDKAADVIEGLSGQWYWRGKSHT